MTTAAITASVAVLVALITQVSTALISRTDRRYDARRRALVDAQDRALRLRHALRRYGTTVPGTIRLTELASLAAIPQEVEDERAGADGEFLVAVSRVEDEHIVRALTGWREVAQMRFIDVADASAAVEEAWFDYVQGLVGAALRTARCRTSVKSRGALIVPPAPPGMTGDLSWVS